MNVWRTRDGSEVAVLAATWELNHKITFDSLVDEFRANPIKAWRNYGSRVSQLIEAALPPGVAEDAANPHHLNPYDESREKFHEWFRGRAGRRYFMHYDLAVSQDAVGMACVHREPNGSVMVDFMRRELIPEGRKVNFAKMREFAYKLTEHGFLIEEITYDQFQSEETRQILEEKGYHTDRESADKDTIAYDTIIEMMIATAMDPIYNRRIDYYQYMPFIEEMRELRLVNGKKYDHPKKFKNGLKGRKDVGDAVACASKRAIMWHLENENEGPGIIRVHSGTIAKIKYGDERSTV